MARFGAKIQIGAIPTSVYELWKTVFSLIVNTTYGLYNDVPCNSTNMLDFLQYLEDSDGSFVPRYRLLFGAFQSMYEFLFQQKSQLSMSISISRFFSGYFLLTKNEKKNKMS